jgi:hypothetical protein
MPFVLVIVGLFLLIAAIRNQQGALFTLLKNDFTGQQNFIAWFLAIFLIGALGYIPKLKPLSIAFLILVILVLFISKDNPSNPGSGGFFQKFLAQIGIKTSTSTI